MTLIAVTILIFISSGLGDTKAAIVSAIMVGAAACVAMSQATDLMLDLKTGYLVGATPRKQQLGQFLMQKMAEYFRVDAHGPHAPVMHVSVMRYGEGLNHRSGAGLRALQ